MNRLALWYHINWKNTLSVSVSVLFVELTLSGTCITDLGTNIDVAGACKRRKQIFTSVDSDEPVQPPFKLRNSKCCSVSSFVNNQRIVKRLAKALIRLRVCRDTCDFQQCGILISVDSDEPVQPPFELRNSKCCSVSSLTIIE